jgi:hypothetical protein
VRGDQHQLEIEQAMNSVLFQPFRLHDLTLANRVVLSPMTAAGPAPLACRTP